MNDKPALVLFCYYRLEELRATINSLYKNYNINEFDLIIFSDGPKTNEHTIKVTKVRRFLKTIKNFNSVTIYESNENKGLASSIIEGVTNVLQNYDKVIVLEDDLITSSNFLEFMSQSLDYYKNNDRVFSVSGYTFNLSSMDRINYDVYFGYRASSWGWGIWKDRWEVIDWNLDDNFKKLLSVKQFSRFLRGGSDLPLMLWKQKIGIIDSWAVRWCYHQSLNNLLTVFPTVSKVENIGFSEEATHSTSNRRFTTHLDNSNKRNFNFPEELIINRNLTKEFKNKFSLFNRLLDRIIK